MLSNPPSNRVALITTISCIKVNINKKIEGEIVSNTLEIDPLINIISGQLGACLGIRKTFFNFFSFQFLRGGPAQKIAEKMTFSTKKVAKYR